MIEIKRRLHKDKWTFKIVTAKKIDKEAEDEDVKGLCCIPEKTILIREDQINYDIISHEIFHAYFSYLHLGDTSELTLSDMEEIGANFFAAEGEEMVRKAKRITKELQKLTEENNE